MNLLQCGRCGAEASRVRLQYSAYDRCAGCLSDVLSCTCPPVADLQAPEQTPIPLHPRRSGHPWEAPDDDLPF